MLALAPTALARPKAAATRSLVCLCVPGGGYDESLEVPPLSQLFLVLLPLGVVVNVNRTSRAICASPQTILMLQVIAAIAVRRHSTKMGRILADAAIFFFGGFSNS